LTAERGANSDCVRAWDPVGGKETLATRVPRSVCSLAVSPDGKWLASGSEKHKLSLFDASTGVRVRDLAGHKDYVLCLAFAPDSRALVSAEDDKDGTILVWEMATGKPRLRLHMAGGRVRGVCVAPNNRLLAAAGAAGVRIWDLATGREVRRLTGHRGVVTAVAFSPDGRTLASAGADSTALLWDVAALTGRKMPGTVTGERAR
jgi:WD40 repeat protein